jgi:DNA-binding CsgD family transcriptional regulator
MKLIKDGISVPPRPISHRPRSWDNRRVRTKTRAVADLLPLGFFVVAGVLIAFAARVTGLPYFGTDPAVVASLGVGALATAAVGHATWRNDRTVGVTIVLAAWTIAAYLFVLGLAGLTHASAVVRLAVGGHVPPLTLFVVTGLIARRSLLGGRAISWPVLVSVALAGIVFVATLALAQPGPPFERVSPIVHLPDAVQTAATLLNFLWLATLLLPPALLIWTRRSDTRADPGRLATAAVASFVPVCQILLCTLLGFAVEASGVSRDGGAVILLVGLGAAWPLTAVGYGLAIRGRAAPYTVSTGVLARAGSLVLGLMTAMIAICAGLFVSLGHGIGTTLAIAVSVFVVALALRPIAARVLAAVVGEATYTHRPEITSDGASPQVRREPSRLSALSGREREVLRLLAAGLSNAGIAAELVLSERTIDAHLRSVFGKLEVPDSKHDNRRVQAAGIWASESHYLAHRVDAPEIKV